MQENERITTVLVDTCAFRDANSDFIGIGSSLLPSFFSAINDKEILLLQHPILEREIEKHIEDSGLYKDYQNLISQLNKCKYVLQHANCFDENLFKRISKYDIKGKCFESYRDYYKDAVSLDYPNPEIIFEQYFSAKPPFSLTGKKKNEFPDAFVIEATKQYLEDHPNDILLAVSKDGDWENAFANNSEVIVCQSIDEALKKINGIESILSNNMLNEVFRGVYEGILINAKDSLECECYELIDYEFIEDLEIDSIKVEYVDDCFTPLKISRDRVLLKSTLTIKVSGHGEIFDEDRSIWDSEDKEYIIQEFSDIEFSDGYAEVDCEIGIIFDFDNPENSAEIDSFKLISRGNISVSCNSPTITPISNNDMAIRCLREDKGYSRRI